MRVILLLFGCANLIVLSQCEGIVIIGPEVIQPNRDFTVVIHNSFKTNVNLKLTLSSDLPSPVRMARINGIETGSFRSGIKKVTFQLVNIPNSSYRLSIQNVGGPIMFDEDVELRYVNRTMSIFIQTDKLVYKPGELLRFRIIVMNIETKPILQLKSLVVDLKDAKGHTIRRWERTSLYNGVFEENVLLGAAPVLGNWSLAVTADDGLLTHEKEKTIEVREYVLPKFLIKVSPSKVLLVDDRQIDLTVQSTYTFGDPVNGQAKVDLYLTDDHRRPNHSSTISLNGIGQVRFNLGNAIELEDDEKYRNVMVNVSMVEDFSGRMVFKYFQIPVYKYQYDITMMPSAPEFIPGQKYSIDFTVKDHSGSVPDGYHKLKLTVTYTPGEIESLESRLEGNGVATFVLQPPEDAREISIEANFDTIRNYELGTIYEGSSQLKVALKSKLKVNGKAEFIVESTTKMQSFTYVVVTKGNIVHRDHVKAWNRNKANFNFKFTPQMVPKSTVVVFSEGTGRETIYYCLEIEVPFLSNHFKFFADNEEFQPGQDIQITTDAAGDSYVAFNAIDQSALLLGHDTLGFTKQDVLNELDQYVKEDHHQTAIGLHGLFLVSSNGVDHGRSKLARFGQRLSLNAASSPVFLRTDFHEVFLWHNFSMDGLKTDHTTIRTVPDTITSWHVTAFALSPTLGLGMMDQPVKFVVKKPFYIIANLPYSIKRNEISLIQVTVFSFLGSEITTDVMLYSKNDEIEFIGHSSSRDTKRWRKAIMVPGNYGKQTSFMIKAKKLGNIAIKIEAVNELASDGIEHILLVTPESHAYKKVESRFIENNNHGKVTHPIGINIPRLVDEGSVNITFSLDPIILGLVKENLHSLLSLPTGCGEQNMVKFMPNVVVLDYLKEIGKLDNDIETKAIDYLNSGYQNQLKFKRSDGSFSVFTHHESGGTFLTAFVAKSFKIADKYISVDRSIVNAAFNWLANIQKSDGLFKEVGVVYNSAMQGGLNSRNLALSAFVVIAFLENIEIATNYSAVVNKTIDNLAGKFDVMDTYELALTTFALSLYDHPEKSKFLDELIKNSQLSGDSGRHWNEGSLNVEIASYAVLSLVAQGKHAAATSIMRWLVKQREGAGAFWGPQDTFVGLKALATMASFIDPRKNDYKVTIHKNNEVEGRGTSIKTNAKIRFDVTGYTQQVQHLPLPTDGRSFKVDIEGKGFGIFQITYQYNQNMQVVKPGFTVKATIQDSTTNYKQVLRVCTKFNQRESGTKSNMALVEVFLPSGFVADQDSVWDLWREDKAGKIQLIERRFGDTSVAVYYNSIDTSEKCFEVTAYRRFKIARQLPANVVVYDYNDKDKFGIATYEGKVLQPCDICGQEECYALRC